MSRAKTKTHMRIIGLSMVLLLAVLVVQTCVWIWSPAVPAEKAEYDFYIPSDAVFDSVVTTLLRDSIIDSERGFRWVAKLKKYNTKVKAGRYRLLGGMSNNDLVNLLRSGGQTPVTVTFNNIDHVHELAGVVSGQLELDSAQLVDLLEDPIYLKSKGFSLEEVLGVFIPNTYEMYWNTDAEDFINRMVSEHNKFWNADRRAAAEAMGMSPNEVSALASIVERETVQPQEQKTVAGLYINRLMRGWKLQSDPTVIYALKRVNPDTVIRRVLTKDLSYDSPYNTYLYGGLPPGPIAAPSIRALEAVLHYERHNYMYMCASVDRTGYHEFASTLSGHNRNAARYRSWLNRQRLYR